MSFLGGVDLSNAAQRAITADLELRRKRVTEAARFLGYYYRGGADLVLREGKYRPGRVCPEQYRHLMGPESECFTNSLQAAMADPTLRYCEGYVTSGFGLPILHGWCVAPDDGVVELTLPTVPEERERYQTRLHLPFLPAERWAYYGVIFDTELVIDHSLDTRANLGLPMLDRSPGELRDPDFIRAGLDMDEPHDFPVLKAKYDPNRKALP